MGGNTKRRIAGFAITGLVIAGVAGTVSLPASGQTMFTEASGAVFEPYGTLRIELDSATSTYRAVVVKKDDLGVERNVEPPQTIEATQPCATVDPAAGTLLTLSPTPGSTTSDTVQIRDNAFGVNTDSTSCGSSAAATISGAGAGEFLKIELGSSLSGVAVKSASLNLTRFKSGNLTVGFDDGQQVPAGRTDRWSSQTVSIDNAVITTADDLFTSITIGSTSTKANEGISVATGTNFDLVRLDPDFDVAVDCGEFVSAPGPGAIATTARYERLDNKDQDAEDCQEVGVRVQIQDEDAEIPFDRVFWNNDVDGLENGDTQNVQAYFTIEWAPAVAADLDREIDYTGSGDEEAGSPTLWCARYDGAGIPILPAYEEAGAIEFTPNDDVDDLRAPWCLVEDLRVLNDDGLIVQTQKLFGSGDPWAR